MLSNAVKNYISSAKGLPFFYSVGDGSYNSVLEELIQSGLTVIRVSDFCIKDDKYPNIDDLIDYFRTSDVDFRDNKFVVVGFGEYLALRGSQTAAKELRRMKNITLGNAKVVLLLRGISSEVNTLIAEDNRIVEQQRVELSVDCSSNISAINIRNNIQMDTLKGIKNVLKYWENGSSDKCYMSSILSFDSSLIPIINVTDSYSILKLKIKDFSLNKELGNNDFWERLLNDYIKSGSSLKAVFNKYQVNDAIDEIYNKVAGYEYKNWLYFLLLKLNNKEQSNTYLQDVIDSTDSFEDLKNNLLCHITTINHTDNRFLRWYWERKKLVKDFPVDEVVLFIEKNSIDPKESIYRLTDNTISERKAIIKWISLYGKNDIIDTIYPDLASYLNKYIFHTDAIADELTSYFDQYKVQKVTNTLTSDFMSLMEQYAKEYKYTKLPTRDSIINAITDKRNTSLYWIDALGVEYLSYIVEIAKQKGLSLHIDIARADLPTITSINKTFYDSWEGKKFKEDRLDELKHKASSEYDFSESKEPIHLADELCIIEQAISRAARDLALHKCKKFVIASDHGASRLAVIKSQEEKYDTDTKGEHSGRCCKIFEPYELEYAIEENGYIVLSNYGRFKGSRAANVEVHGGATLEEIVVPIITLSLKKSASVEIVVLDKDSIYLIRHKGIQLSLYISDVSNISDVSITINDVRYKGISKDNSHFDFDIPDIKRAKTYTGNVYDGEDLIGTVEFTVRGKSSVNSDFDDLF